MPESRATTIRFTGEVYARLEQVSRVTGLAINALVTVACLDFLQRYPPETVLAPPQPPSPAAAAEPARAASPPPAPAFDRFTGAAKRALTRAHDVARLNRNSTITPEHLLLALHQELIPGGSVVAQTAAASVPLPPPEEAPAGMPVPSAELRDVIRRAFDAAQEQEMTRVATHHLVLAILRSSGSPAAAALRRRGLTIAAILASTSGAGVEEEDTPALFGPPVEYIGELVVSHRELLRREDLYLAIDQVLAFPTGFEFTVSARTQRTPAGGVGRPDVRLQVPGGPALVATCIQADGEPSSLRTVRRQRPISYVYWVAGPVPEGSIAVTIAWPRFEVEGATVELDGAAIAAAGARATTVWPDS